jgi:hypothetical protein
MVSRIAAVSSGESVLVQLCDLLLGATQARFNQSNTGSAAKLELTEYLESGIGHRIGPTWKTERKFNVFRIELAASES